MTYIRHTPDNVIEPMLRIPEEEMLTLWKSMVPHEFRPGKRTEYMGGNHFTEEMRQACSDRGKFRRMVKQHEYASECSPQEDGDETILRLFSEGLKIAEISKATGRRFKDVRGRVLACHPHGRPLK